MGFSVLFCGFIKISLFSKTVIQKHFLHHTSHTIDNQMLPLVETTKKETTGSSQRTSEQDVT